MFRVPSDGGHSMASMLWHQGDPDAVETVVRAVRADDEEELPSLNPSFIKIDVEGAKALVVSGMANIIRKARPVVFLECSELGRESTWRFLRGLSYRCRDADEKRVADFEAYRHGNFLWLPASDCLGTGVTGH